MRLNSILNKAFYIATMGLLAAPALAEKAGKTTLEEQKLYTPASQESFKGPSKYFTGDVQVDMVFPANNTASYSGAYVTFQPGARTAWHSHPAGQHIIVTEGTALTGTRDGNIIKFEKGEAVWCPPGIDHWHGAAENKAMTHLVITGSKDGNNVVWKEKVTDAEATSQ